MKIPKLGRIIILGALLIMLIAFASGPVMAKSHPGKGWNPGTNIQFYVPKPNRGAIEQIIDLIHNREWDDVKLIGKMVSTPQSVWFTAGTPQSVKREVRRTVRRATAWQTVPVLVIYNIPFRDCAQFSAGGATTVDEYKAWIDGFAKGIGNAKAVVILEPDGLGIIPWYKPFQGTTAEAGDYEWCQPAEVDAATAAAERFEMLNYAVDTLKAKPHVAVYLDGTHSDWLNISDASHRLIQAGVEKADGFYLNVSNYQFTANSEQYGTWISSCIDMWVQADPPGSFVDCPNQYWNGGPDGTKIADLLGAWTGVALSSYGEWSDESDVPEFNTSGINARYPDTDPATHFVIDTSRNGVGPWEPPAGVYPDPQDWCNPPNRGVGLQPTIDTGNPLIDAYLWVKIPGESDGECTRGLGPAGETVDPEWGLIDPPAGEWFPEMALDLVHNANPPLLP